MQRKTISGNIVMATVLAVLLRALIPVGFMPNLDTQNAFHLVICTGSGEHQVAADGKYNPFGASDHTPDKHIAAKPCEFSLTSLLGPVPAMQLLAALVFAFVAAYLTARREFKFTRGRYYSSSSPRAPPVSV